MPALVSTQLWDAFAFLDFLSLEISVRSWLALAQEGTSESHQDKRHSTASSCHRFSRMRLRLPLPGSEREGGKEDFSGSLLHCMKKYKECMKRERILDFGMHKSGAKK